MDRLCSYQLGIDLGTTYTAAAVCRTDGQRWAEPEVVTLGTRGATVPSVLFVAEDGSVVVGDAAERRALTDPGRVVREFKRRIGDATPLLVAGREWTPEELSARLVRWVADRVAEREGGPAERIAVTHPASWGPHKRELLGAALAAHGLRVTFLAEPQAAALHYAAAERVEPGSTVAVYDLGGGTFDAAVVRKAEPGRESAAFGLLGRAEGLDHLGGVDFDELVFEHVREALPDVFAGLDPTDPDVLAAVSRIRRDCTEAKEALSSDTEVSIPVLLPAARGTVRLHRSEFEDLVAPLVAETVSALRAAVASAGVTPEELTAVLLVGGSSRIPLVAQTVSGQLGRPVAVDADPKNAIAKGAALAVSPRPTASWPGVVVAPVPAVPVTAGAVAGAGTRGPADAAVSPPPRPARFPATPPQGAPRVPGPGPGPAAAPLAVPDPRTQRPSAAHRPDHDGDETRPASAVLPPVHDEPGPRHRFRLLAGAGGLVAVAGLVTGALMLGGAGSGASFDTTGNNVVPSVPALVEGAVPPAAVPPAAVPSTEAPAADRDAQPTSQRPRTSAPAVPPAAPMTTAPPPAPEPPAPEPTQAPALPDPGTVSTAPVVPTTEPQPTDPPPLSGGGGDPTTQPAAEGPDPTSPEVPATATDAV